MLLFILHCLPQGIAIVGVAINDATFDVYVLLMLLLTLHFLILLLIFQCEPLLIGITCAGSNDSATIGIYSLVVSLLRLL